MKLTNAQGDIIFISDSVTVDVIKPLYDKEQHMKGSILCCSRMSRTATMRFDVEVGETPEEVWAIVHKKKQ